MIRNVRPLATLAALAVALTAAPRPAAADGAASTRNIIFGAAAAAGALIIINHNKKVHEKYAEYDRRQAQLSSEANNAEAAYQSERQAYQHEAALVGEYKKEVAYQHSVIAGLRHQLAMSGGPHAAGFAQAAAPFQAAPSVQARNAARTHPERTQVAYGWGNF